MPGEGRELGGDTTRKAGQRPRFFVVFGNQRTGSTLVASRLNSHPRIVCYEEVLLPWADSDPSLRAWLHSRGRPQWLKVVPAVKCSFLASLADRHPGAGAVGFKMMYEQISLWPKLSYIAPAAWRAFRDPALHQWLRSNDVLIVHTLRRNHLKMIVSHLRAAHTGQFHSRNVITAAAEPKIVVPLRGLVARLRRIDSAEKAARKAIRNLEAIEIWYEDYVSSKRPGMEARLCEAIGQAVPAGGLRSPLAKVASDDLRDVVANYEQVAARLSGTRYEKFLA